MDFARTVLVALIALSVALLPVAGASTHAFAPGDIHVTAQSDCCPQGQDCAAPGKGECGKAASCALKCSGVFAATLTPVGLSPAPLSAEKSVFLSESPTSRSTNPPLPPPRV
jgi:hypothetical protein